ncbi:hypothetical protein IWQ47_001470 [Aquimarina sp. EL_43]|uniref:hypothetical protein n=1 Tax=unclassified Aquimarina TaxID=2627091 RepID=UPI0018CAF3C6|nr:MULTISPECIES: hypothetical protein [unclassified Aquimarina]MBG6130447.1 hypothetical protein [Aquimarina sp. EL_35]MBG6149227.1 hypothetical protein [Aquimarina sp. EL_32]MBG6168399.1 hypothetical protein [Aquimarina sp. EL_43]
MKSFYLILISFTFLFLSCNNDDDTTENTIESLVFGKYAGECLENCFTVFKIDTEKITKDTTVKHYTNDFTFKNSFVYSREVFEKYNSLLSSIPDELKNGTGKSYGCPDCVDQGAFYLVVQMSDGKIKKYNIDVDNTEDQSTEIVVFKNKITNTIEELRVID